MMNNRRYQLTRQDRQAWDAYLERCRSIKEATAALVPDETEHEKAARRKKLTLDFEAFCLFYLSEFMDKGKTKFGWFHKKAARDLSGNGNGIFVLEWAREHAKSVFADVMMPMFLYARGELTGMIVASSNLDKAKGLLSDLQAQFDSNQLWINDYGELASMGNWSDGHFATKDGIGFWAFGRGQSPRGARVGAKRPNYAVCDDIDDKKLVKNETLVREVRDWILEDVYGCLPLQGSRLVVVGNRIHKHSTLAHIVGDLDAGDAKRPGIHHIKVFAFENPKNHAADPGGQPAWKERYTRQDLERRRATIGDRAFRREMMHEHIEEGNVFRHDWMQWTDPMPRSERYEEIVTYVDPSWKGTKTSDFKAIVTVGKSAQHIHILKAWVRQASVGAMVAELFDRYEIFKENSRYYLEANANQDLLYTDEIRAEERARGYVLPYREDRRNKGDKFTRIENLSPFFERGLVFFSETERKNPDMLTLVSQLLDFPDGNDDAPDALEGAISLLQKTTRTSAFKPRLGKYATNRHRK